MISKDNYLKYIGEQRQLLLDFFYQLKKENNTSELNTKINDTQVGLNNIYNIYFTEPRYESNHNEVDKNY